jgi:hypothetical protein
MSACLIALVVFAFLGIFSAKYRRWAREAFDCVSRRLTLRPCRTEFNQKVRAKITSKLMKRHSGTAKFTLKHFESISWVFTVVLIVSLLVTVSGAYNLAVYGTCDPLNPEACVFNQESLQIQCQNCTPCLCDNQIVCEEGMHDVSCTDVCVGHAPDELTGS